jgi:hypothetical protein
MSGIKKDKAKLANKFIHQMAELMSEGNSDGLGYAALDHRGNLFGERWWYNDEAFVTRNQYTKGKKIDTNITKQVKESYKDFVKLEDENNVEPIEKYNSFGTLTDTFTAITLHTRMATSGREFANTHPFIDLVADTSLVHNGVIRNHTIQDQIRSTCDSERILNKYLEHEVMKLPSDIQNLIDDLKGYFACGIFSRDNNGKRILDVFRTRASLSAAYIKELDCLVFSTKLNDIKNACSYLGLTIISKAESVNEDTLVRIDPFTGKPILTVKYTDTTNRDVYTPPSYTKRSYLGHSDTLYQDEMKKWEEEVYKRNNVFPFKSEAEHQQVTEEEKSLMKKGFTLEGARQQIKLDKESLPSVAEINKVAIEEINKVNEIIANNSNDPFNENEAAMDDWFLDEDGSLWVKKTGTKH